ncbi:MAG: zinc-binding dehydrogenase [Armatimonadetes bacterium]|nr:zinc-binding dehydrogenase [Armatimonadota bacterium]
MLAARFLGHRRISVEEVPTPEITEPDQCMVRVMTCGICGTDRRMVAEPVVREEIMGHEAAGQVIAVGEGVSRVQVGDHVAVYNLIGCGDCRWCLQGKVTYCADTRGSVNGGFGGVLVAPERNLLPLPDEMDWVRACLFTDVLGTPHKAMRLAGVGEDDTVVVLGCGPIGLGAVLIAVAKGARVLAADALDYRLQAAESMGAEVVCNIERDEVTHVARDWTHWGADFAFDCTGSPGAALQALECLRPGGRALCVGANMHMEFSPWEYIISRDATLGGSWYLHHEDYYDCLELYRTGKVDPLSMVTHTVPIEEIARGFELFSERKDGCIKVVVMVCPR